MTPFLNSMSIGAYVPSLSGCVYDYRSHFLCNQCFFHGIFTITTKENQYNKKRMCVKVLYL